VYGTERKLDQRGMRTPVWSRTLGGGSLSPRGRMDARANHQPKNAMQRATPAASPDAYVAALTGWRRSCVEELRAAVRSVPGLTEVIKWGNLVYLADGPVLVIRAEDERVLLGYWRGQRLRALEPRLRPGGKYEMATAALREGESITPAVVRRLTREAVRLGAALGDPTRAARSR
jgi:hypothetical protein